MTIKLYDQDAYRREFTATVVSCLPCTLADGDNLISCFEVILDETCFFPEEGGQTSDYGYFDEDNKVFDVQLKAGEIVHYCSKSIEAGETVCGQINWEHRFNNMQQHTGEHIFTGLAHNKYGATNVGFHLSENVVTLDLDVQLSGEEIKGLERESNLVIAEGRNVRGWYPSCEELQDMEYRSKLAIEGDVRIVEIEGTDKCACCAPHVRNTAEVGCLKVQSFQNYKGGVRVSFLCGLRAVDDYAYRVDLLERTYHMLNCPQEEVPKRVEGLMDEIKALKYKVQQLNFATLQIALDEARPKEGKVIIFTDSVEQKAVRNAVNQLLAKYPDDICGLFAGNESDGFSYIIGSTSKDCRKIAANLKDKLMAKGGGSDKMVQGSLIATREDILEVIDGCDI